MKTLKHLLLIIIGIVIIVAALSNRQPVVLQFFAVDFEIEMPLFVLIFLLMFIGVVIGGLVNISYGLCWRRKARKAEQRTKMLEEEIKALKVSSQVMDTLS